MKYLVFLFYSPVAHLGGRPGRNGAWLILPALVMGLVGMSLPVQAAGPAELVKDINTTTDPSGSSDPDEFVTINGLTYFVATDIASGRELWRTDGTPAGTTLFKDIRPGPSGSEPAHLTAVGDTLYFSACLEDTGCELWKSDGTPDGTMLVKDIYPGNSPSPTNRPMSLTAVSNVLYFTADDGENGREIWRSDGTDGGTTLVQDIKPGVNSSEPANLIDVAGTLYFTADNASNGVELWRSSGTGVILIDIRSGGGSSSPEDLVNFGDTLFFSANGGDGAGREVWKSDGLTTQRVTDINETGNSRPTSLTVVGTELFFSATDGPSGVELWKTDGTIGNQVQVADINPGGNSNPDNLTPVGGTTLFFTANNGTDGVELYTSNGTPGNAVVLDVIPGGPGLNPSHLTVVGSRVFFSGDGGAALGGRELWRSDGTLAGTARVRDIANGEDSSHPGSLTNIAGVLFFSAETDANGRELWTSDNPPSNPSASLFKDIFINQGDALPNSLTVVNLATMGETLFFVANDGVTGFELWKSDGTATGTMLIKNIQPGTSSAFIPFRFNPALTAVDDQLFFIARDVTGFGLWVSDGTSAGTTRLQSWPEPPLELTVVGTMLYFSALGSGGENDLWLSNGTPTGTINLTPGLNTNPRFLTAVGETLFFAGEDEEEVINGEEAINRAEPARGEELWKSNGSAATTSLVQDINPGAASSSPRNLTAIGATLYFSAIRPAEGRELWKSDGSVAGTTLVADILFGTGSASPTNLINVDGELFFSAFRDDLGRELWKSDGESATLVANINPGIEDSNPRSMVVLGNKLIFTTYDGGSAGRELWVNDGETTTLLKDINPGVASSAPQNLVAVEENRILFAASDGSTGNELWQTNGTSAGTVQVANIAPGGTSSNPEGFVQLGDKFYFSADDNSSGIELWSLASGRPPIAQNLTLSTQLDTPISQTLPVSDLDGDPLTCEIVSEPLHGTVTLGNPDTCTFTYTPDSEYTGNDSFDFRANDGRADSNIATVTIEVGPVFVPEELYLPLIVR